MKRTAIIFNRKAIKRVDGLKITGRQAVQRYKTVTYMGATFMVDTHPETMEAIEKSIGRRMYVCFGRAIGLPITTEDIQELLPERIDYLKRYKKTIDVSKQTLKTWEEQNALLGDVKVYR